MIFPLLQENPDVRVYACDFSPRAVEFVKVRRGTRRCARWLTHAPLTRATNCEWSRGGPQAHEHYDPARCTAFVCDLTTDPLEANVPAGEVDIVTMIFVLSAIPPEAMVRALRNVASVLRPGGVVIFRDYGQYDMAQLRFGAGHRLEDGLYVRQDGTLAYYFDKGRPVPRLPAVATCRKYSCLLDEAVASRGWPHGMQRSWPRWRARLVWKSWPTTTWCGRQ